MVERSSVKPTAWTMVSSLAAAIKHGGSSLSAIPELLKSVLRDGMWRDFTTSRGEVVQHTRFVDFVTQPPTHGLGATVDLIERLVADDEEATVLLRHALKGRPGPKPTQSSDDNVMGIGQGNSRSYTLERLQRERPDLYAKVPHELSANAAAIEAGFRPRTITIPTGDAQKIATTLRRQLTANVLQELQRLLSQSTLDS